MQQTRESPKKQIVISYKIIAAAILFILLIITGYYAYNYFFEYRDLERTDAHGNTPLMEAVKLSEINRVKTLINRGADVNTTDNSGDTPLLVAMKSHFWEIADVLFARGADINSEDKAGNTPLLLAIKNNDYERANKYIHSGAEVNVINNLGEHPLTVALQNDNNRIIELLIETGADIVVKPLEQLTVGNSVRDITTSWKYRRGDNYSGRTVKDEHLEWLIVAHEHFGEGKSLLITKEIVAKYEFNASYSQLGGRDSWHNSKIRMWLINTFYNRLSDSFKEAIEPCVTYTGGFVIPDEEVFLLSQEELNLGRVNIEGDHGEPIDFFRIPGTRIAHFDDYTWYYWTRSAELFAETDRPGIYYKPRYRVRFVAPGGEIGSEYPLMRNAGVRPATNLNSDTLVTTYTVEGSHVIVWGNINLLKNFL